MIPQLLRRALPGRARAVHLVAFNTGAQLLGRAVSALVGLVQVGLVSHYLHSLGYGQYTYVLSVITFVGLIADMGLGNVGVRLVTASGGARGSVAVASLIPARATLSLAALTAALGFALLAPLNGTERAGVALMSIMYLLAVPGVVGSLFQAELEMHILTAVSVGQSVLGLVLVAVLIPLHASILVLLAAQVVTAAAGALTLFILAMRRYGITVRPGIRAGVGLVREALPIGMTATLNVVYLRVDAVMLGLMRGAADVAHYAAATRFIDLATLGSGALVASLYPLMARMTGDADRERLTRTYQLSTDVMLVVGIPLAVAWCILAQPMIHLVYPSDFEPAVPALRILAWVVVPLFVNGVLGSLVLTLHLERRFFWLSVAATVLNIGLNLAFIPAYGIIAASIITVVSEVFVTIVALVLIHRALHFVPRMRTAGLTVLASAAMAVPLYLLRDLWVLAVPVGGAVFLLVSRAVGVWSPALLRSIMGSGAAVDESGDVSG